jgi:hypothetical protein
MEWTEPIKYFNTDQISNKFREIIRENNAFECLLTVVQHLSFIFLRL